MIEEDVEVYSTIQFLIPVKPPHADVSTHCIKCMYVCMYII